jgi:hypothetical protein
MSTRLSDRTTTDPVVRGILVVTMAVTIVGVLAPIRAAAVGRVHHVTVRFDNQAGLAVQVDALDAAAYGGREVYREDLAKTELANRNWTITIPPDATEVRDRALADQLGFLHEHLHTSPRGWHDRPG